MKEEILVLLFAATARLCVQTKEWCEQFQQISDHPMQLTKVVTQPANKISHASVTVLLSPAPIDSWL